MFERFITHAEVKAAQRNDEKELQRLRHLRAVFIAEGIKEVPLEGNSNLAREGMTTMIPIIPENKADMLVMPQKTFLGGRVVYDPMKREMLVDGEKRHLSWGDFAMFEFFLANNDRYIRIEELKGFVESLGYANGKGNVIVEIRRLRKAIEPRGRRFQLLETLPGGYVFHDVPDDDTQNVQLNGDITYNPLRRQILIPEEDARDLTWIEHKVFQELMNVSDGEAQSKDVLQKVMKKYGYRSGKTLSTVISSLRRKIWSPQYKNPILVGVDGYKLDPTRPTKKR